MVAFYKHYHEDYLCLPENISSLGYASQIGGLQAGGADFGFLILI